MRMVDFRVATRFSMLVEEFTPLFVACPAALPGFPGGAGQDGSRDFLTRRGFVISVIDERLLAVEREDIRYERVCLPLTKVMDYLYWSIPPIGADRLATLSNHKITNAEGALSTRSISTRCFRRSFDLRRSCSDKSAST
jgi:hypothetical protein